MRFELANGFEFAVLGKNLTDEYYFQDVTTSPLTGSGTGTPAGRLGDLHAGASRGRQIMLRVGYTFQVKSTFDLAVFHGI